MRKEDIAKPVDRKKCPSCKYFNQDKKRLLIENVQRPTELV